MAREEKPKLDLPPHDQSGYTDGSQDDGAQFSHLPITREPMTVEEIKQKGKQ